MKWNLKRTVLLLAVSASLLTCTGCGGEEITVTVRNLAEVGISEIQVSPESDKSNLQNVLTQTLEAGDEIIVSFGKYKEEELADGFYLDVYNAEDGTNGMFNMLMLSDGDTVSFYIDDWGLAVGVNMTDEEIAEQKERDHQDYLEMVAEEAAAEAASEKAAE